MNIVLEQIIYYTIHVFNTNFMSKIFKKFYGIEVQSSMYMIDFNEEENTNNKISV